MSDLRGPAPLLALLLLAALVGCAESTADPTSPSGGKADGLVGASRDGETTYVLAAEGAPARVGEMLRLTLRDDGTYERERCYVDPCSQGVKQAGMYEKSQLFDFIHFYSDDADLGTAHLDTYGFALAGRTLHLRSDVGVAFDMIAP